tara:strand:- start:189 stop:422 length:234 start_codon:yes stop_codon:yes gene_type:complete
MERSKKAVTPEIKTIHREKRNKNMKKIKNSMANLEALTSKLKMSFGDSDKEEAENVQAATDVHVEKEAKIKPAAKPV